MGGYQSLVLQHNHSADENEPPPYTWKILKLLVAYMCEVVKKEPQPVAYHDGNHKSNTRR